MNMFLFKAIVVAVNKSAVL